MSKSMCMSRQQHQEPQPQSNLVRSQSDLDLLQHADQNQNLQNFSFLPTSMSGGAHKDMDPHAKAHIDLFFGKWLGGGKASPEAGSGHAGKDSRNNGWADLPEESDMELGTGSESEGDGLWGAGLRRPGTRSDAGTGFSGEEYSSEEPDEDVYDNNSDDDDNDDHGGQMMPIPNF